MDNNEKKRNEHRNYNFVVFFVGLKRLGHAI